MLDITLFREHPDRIKANLKRRNEEAKIPWVDEVIAKDQQWRSLKIKADQYRHERNAITQSITQAKKAGKDAKKLIKEAQGLPDKIAKTEAKMAKLREAILHHLLRIPNLLDDSVPVGKDDTDNKEVKRWGKPRTFTFPLKSHGELIESLGLADFKRGAKVAGAGFVYVKGDLALMDLGLQRFAIDHLRKKGFILVEPPYLMLKEPYLGVVSLDDFEQVMYKIDKDDAYLIATAEHPLVAMHSNETFEPQELPVKYAGVSPCFRREIGSHGVDTRGLFRMHQFNKVEMVTFAKPEESWKLYEEIQRAAEELYEALEIPYRVVNVCTGDIGLLAAKKLDIEAWFPREKTYREVGSCSHDTAYQAVRCNIRFKHGDDKAFVHTMNNTAIATSRTLRAIIENFQEQDGSITVPKALRPYMDGVKRIRPSS